MTSLFAAKVADFGLMLMNDVGLEADNASAFFGNFGRETGGFRFMEEVPTSPTRAGPGAMDWLAA